MVFDTPTEAAQVLALAVGGTVQPVDDFNSEVVVSRAGGRVILNVAKDTAYIADFVDIDPSIEEALEAEMAQAIEETFSDN